MPKLTEQELEICARACRAFARVEEQSAERVGDPSMRDVLKRQAECAAQLAERFEKARKKA